MSKYKSLIITLLATSITACSIESNQPEQQAPHESTSPDLTQTAELQPNDDSLKEDAKQDHSLEIKYQSITLDNGLKVIFHIDRSDPVVAVALTAHVGSAREKLGRTGFAHLFEHLLFLESENLGKGGLDQMSARIGGSGANGSTSRDITNYFQTVPRNALEKMIWAEADKLGYFINTVTEQVLAKEKQVVKNEKRQGVDNRPYGHTQYVIDKNLYPKGHPYSWQVIGSLQDLQSATLADVKEFFNRWYVPNNVSLVISGDFDLQQAKQWVHKYFDEIPAGKPVEPQKKQPAVLDKTIKKFYQDNYAKLPELTLTWPTVPRFHADSYPLAVLTELLSDGKKAPLNQILIDEQKLTNRVSMYAYNSELAGQTAIRVRAFQAVNLNKVYAAIEQGFKRFEDNGFSGDDLKRIKAQQETNFYRGLTSALGKGFQLAQYDVYKNDPGFINQDVKNILAVTKADVMRVYKKYIRDKHFVATSFVPKGQPKLSLIGSTPAQVVEEKIVAGAEEQFDASKSADYTRTPSSFDRSVEPNYDEKPITLTMPTIEQQTLANGINVLSIKHNEVPLVSVKLRVAGGMLLEQKENAGITHLMARLMNRGTKNKTAQQLEEALKQIGAQVTIDANKHEIVVQGTSLSKHYSVMMEIMSEMLLQPRWDEQEFKLLKESIGAEIKQQFANPSAIASIEFDKLIYGEKNVFSTSVLGSESSLASLTLADLKKHYQDYFSANLATLYVVGDVESSAIKDSMSRLESQWVNKKVVLQVLQSEPKPKQPKLYFYDVPNAKQSIIVIGNPSLKATDPDFYLARVANYRLGGGGFASILTQQLREAKGYTYGIGSGFSATEFDGRFSVSTGVRSNVTYESIELIREILLSYQQNLSQKDLQLTKGYFLKSGARQFETPNAKLNILSNIAELNLPTNYVELRNQQLNSLDLKTMKGMVEQYIQADRMHYVVVGDAKTQLAGLEKLGLGKPKLLNP